ncbi:MAG: hypothetical protein FJ265_07585 [Planctomycetes bacterium]|nr:hypothetical protein [Planctomycetota bacterium]
MRTMLLHCFSWLCLLAPVAAQAKEAPANGKAPKVAEATAEKPARTKVSEAGKLALAAAKELAGKSKGLRGAERSRVLEQAAAAYDKVVADFAAEPAVAGAAAFAAAELWRQHGSLPLAEKDYLHAAETDGPRFGQRGLLGAADMQRRLKRTDDALATYQKAAAIEPGTTRAQEARLWQARLLQSAARLDEAIAAFQTALEAAKPGKQVVEAANYLALACIHKGDLEAAERAIDHAEQALAAFGDEDPIVVERMKKAVEAMSAKKALQRARDKANRAAKDAVGLDQARKNTGG